MRNHIRKCKKADKFLCTYCDKPFGNASEKQRHENGVHRGSLIVNVHFAMQLSVGKACLGIFSTSTLKSAAKLVVKSPAAATR